jgi:hypothetical protein
VADLIIDLSDEQLAALQRCAAEQRTTVAQLVQDYALYLASGGKRVPPVDWSVPSSLEIGAMADAGGAFDWLADEPDIYTLEDGEPV